MSASPSSEPGESNDQHGAEQPDSPVSSASQRFPWQLGVSVVAWVLLGGLLIGSALGASATTSDADQGSIDAIQGALGQSAAATGQNGGQHPTLYVLAGLIVLLMALLLLVGQSWSQHVLSVLGVVSVIAFALGGQAVQAIAAFALLVVGAVLLLNRPVQRYFASR
ncbi:MAG TPA: hypothetical protein VGH89_22260 [Pseudonocardia sp.]|jgi:hypothetical protein